MLWNLFPFKGDFSFGKSQKSLGVKSGLQGGWVIWVIRCFSEKLHETWCMSRCVILMKLPITSCPNYSLWITRIVSAGECSSLMQNLMQICCSPQSVILNVTATQYTRSLNSVYRPHWLVQWSPHCLYMCIPAHSPWLPGYINVAQTVLIVLTMVGLFQTDFIYAIGFVTVENPNIVTNSANCIKTQMNFSNVKSKCFYWYSRWLKIEIRWL